MVGYPPIWKYYLPVADNFIVVQSESFEVTR